MYSGCYMCFRIPLNVALQELQLERKTRSYNETARTEVESGTIGFIVSPLP